MNYLSFALKNNLRDMKHDLRDAIARLQGKPAKGRGAFAQRIKKRHQTFWQAADAETMRNTIMTASDPLEKWRAGENWQRKLSNKQNAREFAKMHGCRVPGLYWRGRKTATLDFNCLPACYVIRPTIGYASRLVFLMQDGINLLDQKTYTPSQIKEALSAALNLNPRLEFLVEEFVQTEQGEYQIPVDYKFFMFNGHLHSILVINRLSPTQGFSNYYDEHWQPLKNLCTYYPSGNYQAPPACLPEMIAHAKELSRTYEIFVRIDFYATAQGAVFGEFTPTPGRGNYFTPAAHQSLAAYWDRFCAGKI